MGPGYPAEQRLAGEQRLDEQRVWEHFLLLSHHTLLQALPSHHQGLQGSPPYSNHNVARRLKTNIVKLSLNED